ncbi:MAG: hypothetical protein JRN51_10035 [Nitrososphaerota archaeon]|jgi:hypothetical protein|nr:hypothetical protein [Nitrososphaerota archaeon]MDG6981433.1 hypothetical protein [Nitrososphaerota archaeon]
MSETFTASTATSGVSCAVTIQATFANGATQTQVLTVTAQWQDQERACMAPRALPLLLAVKVLLRR